MPGPGDLFAQIKARGDGGTHEEAATTPPMVNPMQSALLAQMLQSKKRGPPPQSTEPSTDPPSTTTITTTTSSSANNPTSTTMINEGDAPFVYNETLDAFLFFSTPDQQPSSFTVRLVPDQFGNDTTDILVPLAPCIYRLTDYTIAKKEPVALERCVHKLGVLRCLARECRNLNGLLWNRLSPADADIDNSRVRSIEEDELGKARFMELLSNCGVYQKVSEILLQRAARISDLITQGVKDGTVDTYNENNFYRVPQVHVEGLEDFLQEIDKLVPLLKQARAEIEETQAVSFYPGLGELFHPGSKLICHPEGMEGSPLGCSCLQSWYAEELNKATNKVKRRFVLVIEFIISVGEELVFVAATDVYPEFHDLSRNVPIKDLKHHRLLPETNQDDALVLQRLQQRGEFYASVATRNHFLEYYPDSFFPIIGGGWNSNAVRPLSKGGRIMVDVKRGILEGHLPVRGSSCGMSDTVKEAIKLFEQNKRTGIAVPFRTAILPGFDSADGNRGSGYGYDGGSVDDTSDRIHLWQSWPMLTGFSFTARVWGKLLLGMPKAPSLATSGREALIRRPSLKKMGVEFGGLGGEGSCGNCGYIKFQEKAFDQLVLAEDKKELIRAVARNAGGGKTKFENVDIFDEDDDEEDDNAEDLGIDVVANKGAASIFLLNGPPGCGKTLTAEAIAELLRKPLYIVTAGDLGITASEVEKTLGAVLDLCQTWDALVLIDEADIFLEARNSTEIQRNALVCVMLRLLEYYSGCLFLSSNRSASSIDAAIASRITVMLYYPALDEAGRAKVWKNLIELVPSMPFNAKSGGVVHHIAQNPRKASKYRADFSETDYLDLAKKFQLNGRQIKNSIVLARALARERGQPMSMPILHRAVLAVAGDPTAPTDLTYST